MENLSGEHPWDLNIWFSLIDLIFKVSCYNINTLNREKYFVVYFGLCVDLAFIHAIILTAGVLDGQVPVSSCQPWPVHLGVSEEINFGIVDKIFLQCLGQVN